MKIEIITSQSETKEEQEKKDKMIALIKEKLLKKFEQRANLEINKENNE